MWDQSIDELFHRGGFVMWPLLVCSIVGVAIILERGLVVFMSSAAYQVVAESLRTNLAAGRIDRLIQEWGNARNPVSYIAGIYLKNLERPESLRDEIVGREASILLTRLEKRLGTLALIAQIAPLLGLLGTVTGLVDAFHQIEIKSGQVQPADLAAGIWEALLTTVFGLVIAVPCQLAHHWIDSRIATIAIQLEWIVCLTKELTMKGTTDHQAAESPLPNATAMTDAPVPSNTTASAKSTKASSAVGA